MDIVKKIDDQHSDWKIHDIQRAFELIIHEMSGALAEGSRIEIRGFGSFQVKERQPRLARNPKTNGKISLDSHVVPSFRAGKELKELLNNDS